MQLIGTRNQAVRDLLFDNTGSLTSTALPALVLPDTLSRSLLTVENLSAGAM